MTKQEQLPRFLKLRFFIYPVVSKFIQLTWKLHCFAWNISKKMQINDEICQYEVTMELLEQETNYSSIDQSYDNEFPRNCNDSELPFDSNNESPYGHD